MLDCGLCLDCLVCWFGFELVLSLDFVFGFDDCCKFVVLMRVCVLLDGLYVLRVYLCCWFGIDLLVFLLWLSFTVALGMVSGFGFSGFACGFN